MLFRRTPLAFTSLSQQVFIISNCRSRKQFCGSPHNDKKPPSFLLQKDESLYIPVLPPLFTDSSHCLPLQVQLTRYSKCCNVHQNVTAYSLLFGVKLREVFALQFSWASHLPAPFCRSLCILLVPIFAFLIYEDQYTETFPALSRAL